MLPHFPSVLAFGFHDVARIAFVTRCLRSACRRLVAPGPLGRGPSRSVARISAASGHRRRARLLAHLLAPAGCSRPSPFGRIDVRSIPASAVCPQCNAHRSPTAGGPVSSNPAFGHRPATPLTGAAGVTGHVSGAEEVRPRPPPPWPIGRCTVCGSGGRLYAAARVRAPAAPRDRRPASRMPRSVLGEHPAADVRPCAALPDARPPMLRTPARSA